MTWLMMVQLDYFLNPALGEKREPRVGEITDAVHLRIVTWALNISREHFNAN
jgi:hypothetical protein